MIDVRPSDIDSYVAARRKAGAAPATVNREMEVLARGLVLGRKEGLFTTLRVRDHRLEQASPRQGFFEPEAFASVMRQLTRFRFVDGKNVRVPADDLRLACAIANELGWRMQSEVLAIRRANVDLGAGMLRLDSGTTKNKSGRVAYCTPALRDAIAAQLARIEAWQRRAGRVTPYLFTHLEGRHQGKRIGDFVRAWKSACRRAGQSGKLRHDFRRTAVRGMVNAGVPERVSMAVTGHKTRSVFDRYHIVAPADLQRAASLLAQAANGVAHTKTMATSSGV
jgi:integrase